MAFVRTYAAEEPTHASMMATAGATVLEFGTPWCGHCIAAQPLIEAALRGRDDIAHVKVEDGRGRALGRAYAVRLWPTLVLLRDGIELARVVRPGAQGDVDRLLLSLSGSLGGASPAAG